MGRYSTAHAEPNGAGDARPTALEVIHNEGLENKLVGKVIVITGATSGIGLETARSLSATGATLLITARDSKKTEAALAGTLEAERVTVVEMDNSSLKSVRKAAATILSTSNNKVNILINNAGVMGIQTLTHTEEGHEVTFVTNHLSHFLLFQLLKPALLSSSTPEFASRVVNVSSSSQRVMPLLDSDNYNFEKQEYNFMVAYANSKLANVYMANELDRRYGSKGLHGFSLHPGGIHTNIGRHVDPSFVQQLMQNEAFVKVLKSPEQGAATTVFAAVSKELEGKGGLYLEDCEEAKRGKDDGDAFGAGYVKHTFDAQEEARLWKDSLELVGMTEDA